MTSTPTTEKRYLVVRCWSGRCQSAGSDKVWAGALVKEDGEAARTEGCDSAPIWHFLAVYGKTGSNLNGGDLSSLPSTRKAAESAFEKKVKEKAGPHHYVEIAFAPFLASFKVPLVPSAEAGEGNAVTAIGTPTASAPGATFRYEACTVVAFAWERCLACLASPLYGWTEKENGERCITDFDGGESLVSYNRLGHPMTVPPQAAQHLRRMGHPVVVDGERLMGQQAGGYAIFDVLEWDGEDIRHWPYQRRVSTLQQAMFDAGLITRLCATPTHESAAENSAAPGLFLLVPAPGGQDGAQQVVEGLRDQGREGVVVRKLVAGYQDARAAQKYKFLAELDAVVIGIAAGSSAGSARLGLVRPSDGAVIEVGRVRAGLSDTDIRALGQMLARGEWPVLTVGFLPIRTVGITLVEPRTSLGQLRSDKRARDCTTDQFSEQFGSEKDALIQQAQGLSIELS